VLPGRHARLGVDLPPVERVLRAARGLSRARLAEGHEAKAARLAGRAVAHHDLLFRFSCSPFLFLES